MCDADESEPEAGTIITTKQINKFENSHWQQVQRPERGAFVKGEQMEIIKRVIREIRETKRANKEAKNRILIRDEGGLEASEESKQE